MHVADLRKTKTFLTLFYFAFPEILIAQIVRFLLNNFVH